MRNLFFATFTWALFLFYFGNVSTRIDELFNGPYTYTDFAGDAVLALAALALVFLVAAIKDAFKR